MSKVTHRSVLIIVGFLAWAGCDSSDPLHNPLTDGTGSLAGAGVPAAGASGGPVAGSSVPSGTTAGQASGAAGMMAIPPAAGSMAVAGATGAAGATSVAGTSGAAGTGAGEMPAPAGMGGVAGGMAVAGSPAAGAAAMPREDLGKGDGSDVIAFGDSWMSLGATGIQQSLVRLSGQPYRTYGIPGTRLLDGAIPRQYASAKRANPDIKTAVMTGGGNDILLTSAGNDRGTAGPNTRAQIDKIAARLVELWAEMGADGVKDIVYIEYSRGGGEAGIEYATGKIKPLCEAVTPARCHWVDSDIYIMSMLAADGIHPSSSGYNKIAAGVIELMEKEGMRR